MVHLRPLDLVVLAVYFAIVAHIGIVIGKKRAKTLGDFFIPATAGVRISWISRLPR